MTQHIKEIGFLIPGNFDNAAPFQGIEDTIEVITYGEKLGFDGAWVRQRHLEPGIGSAAVFLAAASQRTSRIQLGSAVIQIGYESPFRLAEDLSMVDVLSRGRLNVGLSAGVPPHSHLIAHLIHDGDWTKHDLGHERIKRFRDNLGGHYLGNDQTFIATPFGPQRPRLQPHAEGLANRLWYGAGSQRSARWAGENGFNLLTGNVVSGEGTDDFHAAQVNLINTWRAALDGRPGRVALGRVIVPTDSAPPARIARYQAYAASRLERTFKPQGERRTLFPRDLVGPAEQIVEWLLADPVLPLVSALRLELPHEFSRDEYEQILTDTITRIAPALGWQAKAAPPLAAE